MNSSDADHDDDDVDDDDDDWIGFKASRKGENRVGLTAKPKHNFLAARSLSHMFVFVVRLCPLRLTLAHFVRQSLF